MAGPQLQWADASELTNRSRPELPATFLLRVTDAACADMGIEQPAANERLDEQHPLVQKFVDSFTDAAAIDDGRPFAQMPGLGLYRIKRGEWRGLVWTDKEAGVVWLCRAVFLGDYPSETLAYDALEAMGKEGIFPDSEEREDAKSAQVLNHAVRALRDAMQEAHELPNSWQYATMMGPGQGEDEAETIGRAYVELIEVDGEEVIDRFLIAVVDPPAERVSMEDWIGLLSVRVFPSSGGEVDFVVPGDLPPGPLIKPGPEIALGQMAL